MLGWQKLKELGFNFTHPEFAYNSSVNRSIGMSPFEVVHGYKLRKPINLILMTQYPRALIYICIRIAYS